MRTPPANIDDGTLVTAGPDRGREIEESKTEDLFRSGAADRIRIIVDCWIRPIKQWIWKTMHSSGTAKTDSEIVKK
jgi:hypothetical protein